MSAIPTYVYPFVLAIIAAVVGKLMTGNVRDNAASLPGWILYALAIGCVVIGLVLLWLDHAA